MRKLASIQKIKSLVSMKAVSNKYLLKTDD